MDFEEALVQELSMIAAFENKIYPIFATPGEIPPFIVFVSSEGEQVETLQGFTNITDITCEIHIITDTYRELKELTKVVVELFQTFYGRSIGVDGPFIQSFTYDPPREFHEEAVNYYRTSFDIHVKI